MTDDVSQTEADLRSRIVEALDYEEDDGRPFPNLVAALIAEVHAADARTIATRQMSISADASTRAQLLAALGRMDDGRTTRSEYIAALVAERNEAQRQARVMAAASNRFQRLLAEHECVPTQWAYDQACAALHKHRDRADNAEAERDGARSALDRVRAVHQPIAPDAHGVPGCSGCDEGESWPCQTIAALDGAPAEEQR